MGTEFVLRQLKLDQVAFLDSYNSPCIVAKFSSHLICPAVNPPRISALSLLLSVSGLRAPSEQDSPALRGLAKAANRFTSCRYFRVHSEHNLGEIKKKAELRWRKCPAGIVV